MKVLVCPDKFKGSLTAQEVCNAIELGLKSVESSVEVVKLPLADGGEGTLDLIEEVLSLEREYVTVNDPLFRPLSTYYLKNQNTAYIEMSKASGLQLLAENERNPLHTSTFGTGELIVHALDQGIEEIYLLIGGSATNEGGIGMATALGYEFVSDESFTPNGAGLCGIAEVSTEHVHSRLNEVKFRVLSDVNNPLTGMDGATLIYGSQKGVDEYSADILEEGLIHLAKCLNNGYEERPGAGAAGGLGYGAMSFLNAEIESGIHAVMGIVDIEKSLDDVDLIITGEGKLDNQTAQGKVIYGVAQMAVSKNIPIGIVCGAIENIVEGEHRIQTKLIYPIIRSGISLEHAMDNAFDLVSERARELATDFRNANRN